MAASPERRRPSAILMFLRANWKWLLIVVAAVLLIVAVGGS